MDTATGSTIEIDGIAVQVEGDGEQTLVMIHGWPDTARLWDAQVAYFSARYRCVRFTLPGFDCRLPRRDATLEQLLSLFEQVVRRTAGGRPAILMVHDWGAAFGYQFCMRHPELVERVIGIDIGDAGERRHRATLRPQHLVMMVGYQVWLALAWRVGGRLSDGMTRAMARAMRVRSDPQFIFSGMNYGYDHAWFSRSAFAGLQRVRLTQPLLFAYGRRKPFMFHSPAWEAELRARPGCAVAAFDSGHWVMRHPAFNETVQAWLDGRPLPQATGGAPATPSAPPG